MKKLLLLLLAAGIFQLAHAQDDDKKFAFSIGPELGIPSRSVYSIGYGASAKLEAAVSDRLIISATGGYSTFNYKGGIVGTFVSQSSSSFIPLKAGVRYTSGSIAYLEGELGEAMETSGNKDKLFAFSIGPGFLIHLSGAQNIDLGFRYESWSKNTLQQTAIRVAYRIGW